MAISTVSILQVFSLMSCETYNCILDTSVNCVYGFYASGRTAGGDFVAGSSINVADTMTISILGDSIVLANKIVGQNGVSVPMSYYGDTDSLLLSITGEDGTGYDTIYVSKDNIIHLEDPSCPAHVWHTITNVNSTHHLIDTLLIKDVNINYDGLENLQIYFRVAEE